MKKILLYTALMQIILLMISCHKPSADVFVPAREFTPTSLSISASDTVVTISWPASVNAASGQSYTVQISEDSSFVTTPTLSFVTNDMKVWVTDDSIADNTKYFVRVKANQNAAAADSYWLTDTGSFKLTGRQIFKTPISSDIIDEAAILRWTPTEGLTKLTLTDEDDVATDYELTVAINTAGIDTVYNLKANTTYSAELKSGSKTMGSLSFTTQSALTGNNVIDLRSSTDPSVLVNTLPTLPSGSMVLLKRGMKYDIPSTGYVFNQSVTIRSGLGFGDPAILSMTANFDASGSFDSLKFDAITFETVGSGYVLNVGNVANIGTLSFTNCTTNGVFSNSLVRLKTAGDEIGNLEIDGCVFDSIGVGAKYPILYANASSSAIINNISVTNSTFYYIYYFVREDGVAPASLNIDACTFNDFINQSGYFINYSGTAPSVFNIKNTIFGSTLDPSSSNGIKSSQGAVFDGCYQTSDCIFSGNEFSGVAGYSGAAADLFSSPASGDFTIMDDNFEGKNSAGDPRWR